MEAEVSSLSGWAENTGLGANLGCAHGGGEHDELSIFVSRKVLETALDTKG